jgi:hypothetical protein
VFDYGGVRGTIDNEALFRAILDAACRPTVDLAAYLWNGRFESRRRGYAPKGSIDRVIELPARDALRHIWRHGSKDALDHCCRGRYMLSPQVGRSVRFAPSDKRFRWTVLQRIVKITRERINRNGSEVPGATEVDEFKEDR